MELRNSSLVGSVSMVGIPLGSRKAKSSFRQVLTNSLHERVVYKLGKVLRSVGVTKSAFTVTQECRNFYMVTVAMRFFIGVCPLVMKKVSGNGVSRGLVLGVNQVKPAWHWSVKRSAS